MLFFNYSIPSALTVFSLISPLGAVVLNVTLSSTVRSPQAGFQTNSKAQAETSTNWARLNRMVFIRAQDWVLLPIGCSFFGNDVLYKVVSGLGDILVDVVDRCQAVVVRAEWHQLDAVRGHHLQRIHFSQVISKVCFFFIFSQNLFRIMQNRDRKNWDSEDFPLSKSLIQRTLKNRGYFWKFPQSNFAHPHALFQDEHIRNLRS